MKYLWTIISIVAFVSLFSCNKDKAAAKDIDGSWYEAESKIMVGESMLDVVPRLYDGGMFYFYRCNLKKEDYCDLLIQLNSPEDSIYINYPFGFKIKDDADSLLIKEGAYDTSFVNRFKLESIGKDFFVIEKAMNGDTFLRRVFVRHN